MLTVDGAFDRIGTALRQRGYARTKEEKSSDPSEDRLAVFTSPNMSARVSWRGKARLLVLEVDSDGTWVEFARRSFGPAGLEESTVDALVRAVGNEVSETSTDAD
ncbi:MAG TPA: hypothetical protein VKS03_08535 [Thermoanaerobaculia bacterium]|nr:hypothetical protein [Thermoanaerobaculia bacterium]